MLILNSGIKIFHIPRNIQNNRYHIWSIVPSDSMIIVCLVSVNIPIGMLLFFVDQQSRNDRNSILENVPFSLSFVVIFRIDDPEYQNDTLIHLFHMRFFIIYRLN